MKHVTHFQAAAVTNLTHVQGWRVNREQSQAKLGYKNVKETNTQTNNSNSWSQNVHRDQGKPSRLLHCTNQSLQTDWGRVVTTVTTSSSRSFLSLGRRDMSAGLTLCLPQCNPTTTTSSSTTTSRTTLMWKNVFIIMMFFVSLSLCLLLL